MKYCFLLTFACIMILAVSLCGCDRGDRNMERLTTLLKSKDKEMVGDALDSIDERGLGRRAHARYLFLKGTVVDEYAAMDSAVSCMKRAAIEGAEAGDDTIVHEANNYLAYLSNVSGNPNLAIGYAKAALAVARRHRDARWTGCDYLQLSGSYFSKGRIDSSDYYIRALIPLLEYQSQQDLPDMLNNIAVSHLRGQRVDSARICLERSLTLRPHEHTYYLLAETYHRQGKSDSAEMMWRKALEGRDLYLQSRISHSYALWLKNIGEYEKAAAVLADAQALKDSLDSRGLGEAARAVHEKMERSEIESRMNRSRAFYVVLCVLLLFTACGLWWLWRNKTRKSDILSRSASRLSEQMAEMEALMPKLRKEIETLRQQCDRHKIDACELEKLLGEKGRQLHDVEERYRIKEREMRLLRNKMKKLEADKEETLQAGASHYASIRSGGKASQWNKHDMKSFIAYYMLLNPGFALEVHERYHELSPTLTTILILTDMDFSAERIQDILGMSAGAYRTARSRISSYRR